MQDSSEASLATANVRGSSVALFVSQCLRSFEDFVSQIERTSSQIELCEVTDELGRFRVWAGNIGAHREGRSSLDYRLRDASHIKSKVQSLLADIHASIQRVLQILRGERIPWDQLYLKQDSDSDSTDSDSQDDSMHGETELRQLMSSIHATITLLLRLSMTIRNPAPHDEYMNSANIDESHFKQFDKSHVRNKFPEAPDYVSTVLGEAITRRREYFKYRESHNQKLSSGLLPNLAHQAPDPANNHDNNNEDAGTTVASSLPLEVKAESFHLNLEDHRSESGQTQTSFATSAPETEGLRVPPVPREAREGNPFPCPFCFMIISTTTRRSWKKHVFKDLHPYSCTRPSCTSSKSLFEMRHEWFQHELQAHLRFWQCTENCEERFSSQANFESHVRQKHPEFNTTDELNHLVILCERYPSMDSWTHCHLCGQQRIQLRDLEKHVGKHQEQLALFALPSISGQDEEDSGDSGTDDSASAAENSSYRHLVEIALPDLAFETGRLSTASISLEMEALIRQLDTWKETIRIKEDDTLADKDHRAFNIDPGTFDLITTRLNSIRRQEVTLVKQLQSLSGTGHSSDTERVQLSAGKGKRSISSPTKNEPIPREILRSYIQLKDLVSEVIFMIPSEEWNSTEPFSTSKSQDGCYYESNIRKSANVVMARYM
ncbi:zinc finger transcription factor ace1 [Diplodia corticola]|uniref:Zinc finger transcription factor ace1 n=1 Tax=Diplodia corticola TaxID=236234 RepID=A0A1J9RXP4_9PEZI|nr:zinc finger transcription factor ace1 [Diplodia corticola]OJD33127.1 zinc finger transcription factor ace1 [Diplodia corticola]